MSLIENVVVSMGKDFEIPWYIAMGFSFGDENKMTKDDDELNEVLEVLNTLKMLQTLRQLSEETVQEWAMRMQDSINADPEVG